VRGPTHNLCSCSRASIIFSKNIQIK